jgi:hypothetical protein
MLRDLMYYEIQKAEQLEHEQIAERWRLSDIVHNGVKWYFTLPSIAQANLISALTTLISLFALTFFFLSITL